jgi:hypothetical protein
MRVADRVAPVSLPRCTGLGQSPLGPGLQTSGVYASPPYTGSQFGFAAPDRLDGSEGEP